MCWQDNTLSQPSNFFIVVSFIAPESKYTHWKQTVFYIRHPLTIGEKEQVHGEFVVKPNQRNKVNLIYYRQTSS